MVTNLDDVELNNYLPTYLYKNYMGLLIIPKISLRSPDVQIFEDV